MSNAFASHSTTHTLSEWLCYLETIHATEIDLGLERIGQVAQRLAVDLSFAKVITVAGTNGKGTTCAFLEQALLAQQHNVAVYSSPHIARFNERLRFNQQDVSDQQLVDAFIEVERQRGDISLTYYEFTTLAAFVVMMNIRPEFIILEVGLGGRLDATNVIDADIAVITTVDLDHQAFLGADRETIGIEKAGIFRAKTPAVIGDVQPPQTVFAVAEQQNATVYARGTAFTLSCAEQLWCWQSEQQVIDGINTAHIPMDNLATALMVLQLLAIPLTTERVNQWLIATKVAGRMEHFHQPHHVVLDVAHNPQAARYLADKMAEHLQQHPQCRILAVTGMLADKDIYHSFQPLMPFVSHWYVANLAVARAATGYKLQQVLEKLGAEQGAQQLLINCFDNVTSAFKMACENVSKQDLILVFGSFYTVAEIRTLLISN